MAAVVSNKKGETYPDMDAITSEWKVRFGETDKDTRDNRVKRKASVTTLVPKLAIVNVYQLINKKSRRLAERRGKVKGGSTKSTTQTGERMPKGLRPGAYGFMLPAKEEYDGVLINEYGNPVTRDNEGKHEYNSRVAQWRREHGFAGNTGHEKYVKGEKKPSAGSQSNKKQEQKKTQEQEEAEDEERRSFREKHQAAQDEAERLVREKHAKEPRYILWERAKPRALNIYTSPSERFYEIDPNYSMRDPETDFDELMRIMSGLQKNKILPRKKDDTKNPPIVMIQTSLSQPPRAFFIRNDVSYRRRKGSKVQARRLPMKKIPHGNKKRKVVMRKGGKR